LKGEKKGLYGTVRLDIFTWL